jgi:hypothetical protein
MSSKKDQKISTRLLHADDEFADAHVGPAISVSSSKCYYCPPMMLFMSLGRECVWACMVEFAILTPFRPIFPPFDYDQ